MPAHRLAPAAHHHHRLGAAFKQRLHVVSEVLDHAGNLLRDVVRVQAHPLHDALHGGAVLDRLFVELLAIAGELERQLVAGVVLQHVEDEAFLDGLAHRVHMEGLRHPVGFCLAAEQLQRLGLGRGGERDVGEARRTATRLHLRGEQRLGVHLAAVLQCRPFLGRQQLLQLGRRLAGLRAVRLVGNHREALALGRRQFLYRLQGEREGLDGADDDFLAVLQCLGKLLALAAVLAGNGGHHAGSALEVEDGFLQLRVQHVAVADHQHAVEQLAVLYIVQVGQKVRAPRDGVGLARAGRMLNQVTLAGAVLQHVGHQRTRSVELVVARENHALQPLLVVALANQVAVQDVEPALSRPHFFPQVGRREAVATHRVAGRAVVAAVERQEAGRRAFQLGSHPHFRLAHRKMHQRAAGKGQQWLGHAALGVGHAVEAVLVHRVVHALREVGFQLGGGHRHAVEEQHQVERVLRRVRRVAHLAHHAQPVGGIRGKGLLVHRQRRLELGEAQGLAQPQHLDPTAQHVQRAALVEIFPDPLGKHSRQLRAVRLGEALVVFALRCLHPREQVRQEQAAVAVEQGGVTFGVGPAVGSKMGADFGFKMVFAVQVHAQASACSDALSGSGRLSYQAA